MASRLLHYFAVTGLLLCSGTAYAQTYPVPFVYKGDNPTLDVRVIGTYRGGFFSTVAPETPVAYDPKTQRVYVFSPVRAAVEVLDIHDPYHPTKIISIQDPSGQLGIPTSLAFHDGLLAVSLKDFDDLKPGRVVFADADGNIIGQPIPVGVQPEVLRFTPNGRHVVVINAAHAISYDPQQGPEQDPEASVSIITLRGRGLDVKPTIVTADFVAFNSRVDELRRAGVRISGPNATVAQDVEPDSLAVSPDSQTAWVTLNRNSAIAVVDLKFGNVTDILPLGYKDNSVQGNGLDASDVDGVINIATWPLRSFYMPDGIEAYRTAGKTYMVTANEGDPRELEDYQDDERVGKLALDPSFPDQTVKDSKKLGDLRVSRVDGDVDGDGDFDELYAFGARSFAIWDRDGTMVFESGDDFEQIIAAALPKFFNSSNNTNQFDETSDDRGPEPEQLDIGRVGSRQYVFITFERIGGIMVYDITVPEQPKFELYINNRNFNLDPAKVCEANRPQSETCAAVGDLEPESVLFIPGSQSPIGEPLLVVTQEASDSVTIFAIRSR